MGAVSTGPAEDDDCSASLAVNVVAMAAEEGGESSVDSPGQATAVSNDCQAFDQPLTRQAHAEVGAVSADAAGTLSLMTSFDRVGSDLESLGLRASAEITGTPITFAGDFRQKSGRGEAGTTFQAALTVTDAPVPYAVTQVVSVMLTDTLEGADVSFANVRLVDVGNDTTLFERQVQPAANVDVTAGSPTGTLEPGSYRFECTLALIGRGTGSIDAGISFDPEREIRWKAAVDGAFSDATKWVGDQVPGVSDVAVFDPGGAYTVTVAGTRAVSRARTRAGRLTLEGPGELVLAAPAGAPALMIGNGAEVSLANTVTVTAADVAIGDAGDTRTTVRVRPESGLTANGTLAIGGLAPATLELAGGAATAGILVVAGPEDTGGPSAIIATPAVERPGGSRGLPRAASDPEGLGPLLRLTTEGGVNGELQATEATFGGPAGFGEGIVDSGAIAIVSGATTIGTAGGNGLVRVRGRDSIGRRSTWESGAGLTVGDDAEGTLTILDAGRVTASDVAVGARPGGEGFVVIGGATSDLSARSSLEVTDTLTVGDAGAATLDLLDFGLITTDNLHIGIEAGGNGTVTVAPDGAITVRETLQVGSAGTGTLRVQSGGVVTAKATAISGGTPGGPAGEIQVTGGFAPGFRTEILVVGDGIASVPGVLAITDNSRVEVTGVGFRVSLQEGEIALERGGQLDAVAGINISGGQLRITGEFSRVVSGASVLRTFSSTGSALVDAGAWRVNGALEVGELAFVGAGGAVNLATAGALTLVNGGTVAVTGPLTCGPLCTISGNGVVRVGTTELGPRGGTLTNLGIILPGSSPGTIQVDANFAQGSSGRLVMEVGGLDTGQMDVLDVTGKATLGGTLELRFVNGFAPNAGDVLAILPLGSKLKGAFASVQVSGLAPGFDFTLGAANGALTVTALTNGVAAVCADTADADQDGVVDCADDCPFVTNAPATGGAAQPDADADGIGDACDPCTGGVPIEKPVLSVKKGILSFKGTFVRPGATPLDPAATGVRLLLEDGTGAAVLDATAPAGAFDKATKRGWKKLAFKGSAADTVTAVGLKQSAKRPEPIGFKLTAPVPALDLSQIVPPLRATLVLDPPVAENGFCGEMRFTGPPGVSPLCRTDAKGKTVCTAVKRARASRG